MVDKKETCSSIFRKEMNDRAADSGSVVLKLENFKITKSLKTSESVETTYKDACFTQWPDGYYENYENTKFGQGTLMKCVSHSYTIIQDNHISTLVIQILMDY